jgi:hypothetical protein
VRRCIGRDKLPPSPRLRRTSLLVRVLDGQAAPSRLVRASLSFSLTENVSEPHSALIRQEVGHQTVACPSDSSSSCGSLKRVAAAELATSTGMARFPGRRGCGKPSPLRTVLDRRNPRPGAPNATSPLPDFCAAHSDEQACPPKPWRRREFVPTDRPHPNFCPTAFVEAYLVPY